MGSQRVGQDWATFTFINPVFTVVPHPWYLYPYIYPWFPSVYFWKLKYFFWKCSMPSHRSYQCLGWGQDSFLRQHSANSLTPHMMEMERLIPLMVKRPLLLRMGRLLLLGVGWPCSLAKWAHQNIETQCLQLRQDLPTYPLLLSARSNSLLSLTSL